LRHLSLAVRALRGIRASTHQALVVFRIEVERGHLLI
jgi:hypothetical protein